VIEDLTDRWGAVSLLSAAPEDVVGKRFPAPLTFRGRRMRSGSLEWIFPVENHAQVHAALLDQGLTEISALEIERLRITDRVPAVPQDIGPGELPNEGGLELAAISYNKGCYLGQEVMARLKSMGQVRRRLLRVRGNAQNFPALPAPLFLGDRRVGELRSAVFDPTGMVGLALLSLLHLKPGAAFSFAVGDPPSVYLDDEFFSP
jgi:tRNA-modifying protein YgfZ